MKYDIKDKSLAEEGKQRIEWAEGRMPVLATIRQRFAQEKPLENIAVGACLHVTTETANLVRTLKAGGAEVSLCASNPLSTQDDVAAALVKEYEIPVYAVKGEDNETYYGHIRQVLETQPNITLDDGADLVSTLHARYKPYKTNKAYVIEKKRSKWEFYGSSEETTTGVIRLRAMEKDGALKVPVVAVNDSYTKYLFDNRYGTGQSTIDGILRATNTLLAGKKFVVCGYGWCGRGLALRAKGMGAEVIVCEVDPLRALEARMDGYRVQMLASALQDEQADIVVTTTGNKHVVDREHFAFMKDGIILANSGHFNVEVNLDALGEVAVGKKQVREYVTEYLVEFDSGAGSGGGRTHESARTKKQRVRKRIYVLGGGRLINLVAAEGHPAEVMDLSFANQALAAEWFVQNKGKLEAKVYKLPEKLDRQVASLKLHAMNVKIDELSEQQQQYLESWTEGT